MGTARVKQEEETDTRIAAIEEEEGTRIIQRSSKIFGRKERENEEEKSQTKDLTSVKDLTIELYEGRDSPYRRSGPNLT